MSVNTTPATVADGNPITGALWNAEVRDFATGVQAAGTAYTPTLTGITLGNGTLQFRFSRVGKWVKAFGRFDAGTTTTYSATQIGFSLPVTPSTLHTTNGLIAVGGAIVQPAAVGTKVPATPYITTAGIINFLAANGAANAVVTNLVPATFTTAAVITFSVDYEAA